MPKSHRSRNLGLLARRFAPFREKAVTALEYGLDILVSGMKNRAPVHSGRMRRAIRRTKVHNDNQRHRLYGRAYSPVPWSLYVEYGTVRSKAHPFVRPTQAQDGPLAIRAMANILRS